MYKLANKKKNIRRDGMEYNLKPTLTFIADCLIRIRVHYVANRRQKGKREYLT